MDRYPDSEQQFVDNVSFGLLDWNLQHVFLCKGGKPADVDTDTIRRRRS